MHRSSTRVAAAIVAAGAAAVAATLVACGERTELLATRLSVASDAGPADAAPIHIVVAQDGGGEFTSVQAAVDSLAPDAGVPVEIDVRPGVYKEKLTIAGPPFLSIVGDDPLTTVLTFDDDETSAGGTGKSASVTLHAPDLSVQNVTFENTTPKSGAQAVAMYADGDRQQFENCRFLSYQDTVYVAAGTQYFRSSFIQGDDDFVLGAASAAFDDCTLYNVAGGVAITFPSTAATSAYGFVFFGGSLTAAADVGDASVALGRPWSATGATTFLGTSLGAHILPVGWVAMGATDLSETRFAEYRTTGPGADVGDRADASRQLTSVEAAGITLSAVLSGWVPSFSQ